MRNTKIILTALIATTMVTFTSCNKDDNSGTSEGTMSVKLTDAPIDDANVKATYVTVTQVKVDGKALENFSPQTIEISAYTKGNARLLLSQQMAASSHQNISLVLNYAQDADGNSPGCYIVTSDDMKHTLSSSADATGEITLNKDFDISSSSETKLVLDFDLRKSIQHGNSANAESDYSFVSQTELSNAFRVVEEDSTGSVQGTTEGSLSGSDEVVVYAYKKGTYNENTETTAQGSNNLRFTHAVTSAKVASDGSYKLAFLESGDYEIHVASYSENGNTGEMEFNGTVTASSNITGLLLNNITVEANAQVSLDISLKSILP
jgi:hypothetical protein